MPIPLTKHPGKDVKIYVDINDNGGAGANWQFIAQQTTGSQDLTTELQEARTKDDDGWPGQMATGLNWGVQCEIMLHPGDPVFVHVLTRCKEMKPVYVKVEWSAIGGEDEVGLCWIQGLPRQFNNNEPVKATIQLAGEGKITP